MLSGFRKIIFLVITLHLFRRFVLKFTKINMKTDLKGIGPGCTITFLAFPKKYLI